MAARLVCACAVFVCFLQITWGQSRLFKYEQMIPSDGTVVVDSIENPDCPLETHPDTQTMFIMRGPLGNPEPRTCPPGTYFLRSVCSCVNVPLDKCNLRPSPLGSGFYEEDVFGVWIRRPCGPGSAFSAATCECSVSLNGF